MEPLTLAAAAVALLAPYLGKIGETAGEATADRVARLYRAIKDRFRGDDYAEPILRGAVENPGRPSRLEALKAVLAEVIEDDPEFAADLAELVRGGQTITDSGAVAGRDVNLRGKYVAGRDMHITDD